MSRLVRVLCAVLHAFRSAFNRILRAMGCILSVALGGVVGLLGAMFDGAAAVFGGVLGFMAGTLGVLLGGVVFARIRLLAESHHRCDSQGSSEQQCRYV